MLFDFGQEVGGVTHITFERSNAASGSDAIQRVASILRVVALRRPGDASRGDSLDKPDGTISTGPLPSEAFTFTPPFEKMRGGFRYLSGARS